MLSGLWPRPYPGNVKEVAPKSALCRHPVNPFPQKDSTLSKFGNGVYVAHPGSLLRGDHVVVTFASRACGGRGSVGMRGAGRAGCPCELAAACGRTALSGSSRQQSSGNVDSAGRSCGEYGGPRVRAKPCGPGRRCYGQAVAEVFASPTGRTASSIREAREARGKSAPGRARHKPSTHCAGKAE